MFTVGDTVQHKQTGKVGRVVGYGCRLTPSAYCLTLKVRPLRQLSFKNMEDTVSEWRLVCHQLPIMIQSQPKNLAA